MVNLFWINKKFSVSCIEMKTNFPANTIRQITKQVSYSVVLQT